MSCSATLDIEKIKSTLSSLEDTEKIIAGSDEHLDLILDIQKSLSENSKLTASLVDTVEANFRNYTPTKAQEFIARVFPLFDMAKNIKRAIQEEGIFNEVRSHWEEFAEEVDDLFEIVNDLSRYKSSADDDSEMFF